MKDVIIRALSEDYLFMKLVGNREGLLLLFRHTCIYRLSGSLLCTYADRSKLIL